MKKIIAIVTTVMAYVVLNAQSIYYVDMAKVYQNFYKAKEAATQINASAETSKQELQKMDKQRQDIIKELKAIQEKAKNPALTKEAQQKILETEGQPKLVKLQQLENDMKNIAEQTRTRLRESAQRVQQVHFEEISKEIEKLAAEKKATYVLSKNVCLFADPKFDLSDELLKRINANAPKKN